ncbi:MAG: M13 family metallopeptidase [Sarcina sp.]|nr:M13 family metallopeptidase [Sarcina sp.]
MSRILQPKKKKKMSRRKRSAGLFLASTCFAGAFLVLCITVSSLAGCSITSLLPGSSGGSAQHIQEGADKPTPDNEGSGEAASLPEEDPATASAEAGAGTGDPAGSFSPEGTGADQGGLSAQTEAAFTLPYEQSDPAQSASAHAWICSDLIENAQKLDGLSLTEDFHAAVNRDWLSSNTIPSGYITYDSFAERQLQVDDELREILESSVSFSDPYIAHCQKLVRDYYEMWLDWDARDAAGMEPLREVIAPLLEVDSLEEMTAYLSDPKTTIEALPLSTCFTAANPNRADSIAVYIAPPSLTFQDAMYYDQLDPDSWQTQPRYMYAAGYMLGRLGYSNSERDHILQESYAFECEMAAHMMTTEDHNSEDSSARTNNPRTLQELTQEQGSFPLTGMLEGAGLAHSDVFILEEPEWLEGMRGLYNEAHLERMKDYLLVQDVLQFMELLDHDCYDQMIKVRNYLSGSSGQVDDKKAACDAVNSVLEMELGEVYAETYITDQTRSDVTALIRDIIDYYRGMLENEDFLSDATKAEAVKKLDSLTIRVASPQERVSEFTLMDADGSDPATGNAQAGSSGSNAGSSGSGRTGSGRTRTQVVDFRGPEEGGSLVEARIAISRNTTLKQAETVNQPVDRTEWIAAPQDVNAYYYPLDNSINIPAGILGGIFYNDRMPREEKLAHIGTMVAHEISHAFDTSGRQYDETGNLRNWWTEEDYRRFHERAQKLVDYYNGFEPIQGFRVRGAMLDTEAIADLAGVKCMLRIAADEADFDYDLFFRTIASNWRCLTSRETEAYCIEQDSHPLAYLRTNAVVVQFEEFHRTYGTKEGDGMYLAPQYRLEVW